MNQQFLTDQEYYGELIEGFVDSSFTGFQHFEGAEDYLLTGINTIEARKYQPGSADFEEQLALGKTTSILDRGALLTDESSFNHIDANYNFRDIIRFAGIQIGGSYRNYRLNSGGEIYSDADDKISIEEVGVYAQIQKKLFDDHLKLSFTTRYDKSNNFAYKLSPRASIAYAIGDNKNHNIRFSFQTGFRNPTTQDQYANMNLGDRRIVGTVRDNLERVNDLFFPNSPSGAQIIPEGVVIGEDEIFDNSYTAKSVKEYREVAFNDVLAGESLQDVIFNNKDLLVVAELDYVKPETVESFELGYRGAFNISDNLFEVDIAGFYNIYENFLTHKSVVVPYYGDVDLPISANDLPGQAVLYSDSEEYILRTNTSAVINSYGLNVGFTTEIFGEFTLGANYAFSKFEDDGTDIDFTPEYNTPENVVKISFGHDKLFTNFGFRVDARWQDEYLYQSVFIQDVIDARTVIDAQINYSIPKFKSNFKLGATNIGGKAYTSVAGAGTIGSQYYLNWTINN